MNKPFKFIYSGITNREEFHMGEGYQPTDAVFYLKSGEFDIDFGDKQERIRCGDCCILPGNIHFYRKVIEPISFIYIKFIRNDRCPFSVSLPHGRVEFKDRARFESSICRLEDVIDDDDTFSIYLKEHLLEDILLQTVHDRKKKTSTGDNDDFSDTVLQGMEFIKNNINQKILIDDLCRSLQTNASSLNFKFRKELGTSVGQYIASERMKLAKRLLIGTNYNIAEIAERCGFGNVYYFSSAFKKFYGLSPLKFKNNYFDFK